MKNNKSQPTIQEKTSSGLTSTIFLIIFLLITILSFIFIPILFSLILFTLILFPALLYLTLGKLTKRWGMSLLFSSLIHLVLVILLAVYIYQDTSNLMNNIKTQPKYLLYKDSDNIIFGYEIKDFGQQNSNTPSIAEIQLNKLEEIYLTMDQKDKIVIIVNKELFNPLPETLNFDMGSKKIELPKQAVLDLLKSDKPQEILMNYLLKQNKENSVIPKEILDQLEQMNLSDEANSELTEQLNQQFSAEVPDNLKIMALGLMLAKTFESQGPEYVLNQFNKNNIEIKPNYLLFWIIKHLPFNQIKPYLPKDLNNFKLK